MPRKPAARKTTPASKAELFAAGEVESVVPELSAAQREAQAQAKPEKKTKAAPETQAYRHPEATTPLRPEVGTQDSQSFVTIRHWRTEASRDDLETIFPFVDSSARVRRFCPR